MLLPSAMPEQAKVWLWWRRLAAAWKMAQGAHNDLPMYNDSPPKMHRLNSNSSLFNRTRSTTLDEMHDVPRSPSPAMRVHAHQRPSRYPPYFRHPPHKRVFRFFRNMGRFWRSLILLGLPLLLLLFGLYFYEPHIEIAFYSRRWVSREIEELAPLGGCFSADRPSSGYNISQHVYSAKKTEIHAGLPMRVGLDCYNFAGTIEGPTMYDLLDLSVGTLPVDQRTQYHTYWRADLAPFGQRQEWMLKSFFATQNIARTRLVLWSNGDLSHNPILQKYVRSFPNAFAIQRVDIPGLAKGTELDGVLPLLHTRDDKAWIDGDLIRLLVLWNYGGVWVDMDSLLTRDLEPLLEHEFVTQWDCYDKPYTPFNGALMRFRRHSPYICEAFHIMATSPPPRPKSTDWGSLLYFKLWRRLVAVGIPPFKVLPFCFTEGRSCRLDTRLPDPFVTDADNRRGVKPLMGLDMDDGGDLDLILTRKIFGIHLHNQWEKLFPPGGWVERLLLKKYDERLNGVMNT